MRRDQGGSDGGHVGARAAPGVDPARDPARVLQSFDHTRVQGRECFERGSVTAEVAVVLPALTLLVLVDLFPVGKRYFNNGDFVTKTTQQQTFTPTPADEQILADIALSYRVFDNTIHQLSQFRCRSSPTSAILVKGMRQSTSLHDTHQAAAGWRKVKSPFLRPA